MRSTPILLAFAAALSAQTTVLQSGGRLTLTTNSADQSVKVEVSATSARVFGFAGIADGTTYSGLTGITVVTGNGSDSIDFDVQSSASLDVRIDSGAGQATTNVKWRILPGLAAPSVNVALLSPNPNQGFQFELESDARAASVAVDAAAAREVNAKILSSNPSDFLRVAFQATSPKATLEVSANASAMEADLRSGATAAADELKYVLINGRTAPIAVNWALSTGAGDDKVEAHIQSAGGVITHRGSVALGSGNDFAMIVSEGLGTITGLTLNGGLGADEIQHIIKGRYQASQTLRPTLLGGDGDDVLVLSTDTGIFGTGLPNDVFPLIDCGAGADRFQAFGEIRACEARL